MVAVTTWQHSLLKVSWSVIAETLSKDSLFPVTLNSIGCMSPFWLALILMDGFVILCFGHLKDTGSLQYAILMDVDTLLMQWLKCFCEYDWSHQKLCKYWKACQAHGKGFFKILIFFWKMKFYHCQQILSVVFFKWQSHFIYFRENVSLITIVCQSFFKVNNSILWKVASSVYSSDSSTRDVAHDADML